MGKKARCSFCGSTEDEVSKLFSGIDGALICDRCIESCFDILELSNEKLAEKHHDDL
ncbi:MAG: ClpX C4-type zinc finger protein, partial [Fusobacterium sp.]